MAVRSSSVGRLVGAGFNAPAVVNAAASIGPRADASYAAAAGSANPMPSSHRQAPQLGPLPPPPIRSSTSCTEATKQSRQEIDLAAVEQRIRDQVLAECHDLVHACIEKERLARDAALEQLRVELIHATEASHPLALASDSETPSCSSRQKALLENDVHDAMPTTSQTINAARNQSLDPSLHGLQNLVGELQAKVHESSLALTSKMASAEQAIADLKRSVNGISRRLNASTPPARNLPLHHPAEHESDGVQRFESAVASLSKELAFIDEAVKDFATSQGLKAKDSGWLSAGKDTDGKSQRSKSCGFVRPSKSLGGG